MNLPNKLSLLRLLLAFASIAVFGTLIMLTESFSIGWIIVGTIFIVASFTDFLDGYIARKWNLISDLGKFLDPIADKILVNSTLIMIAVFEIMYFGYGVVWLITIIMIIRDIAVDASRMMSSKHGIVVAASIYGKLKTVLQMVAIPILIMGFIAFENTDTFSHSFSNNLYLVGVWLLGLAAITSFIGGILYLKNSATAIGIKKINKR